MKVLYLAILTTAVFCSTYSGLNETKYQEIKKELIKGMEQEIKKHSAKYPKDYQIYTRHFDYLNEQFVVDYVETSELETKLSKLELLPENTIEKHNVLNLFKKRPYENETRYTVENSKYSPSELKASYEIYSFKSKQLTNSDGTEGTYTVFAVFRAKTTVEETQPRPGVCVGWQKFNHWAKCYTIDYPVVDAMIEAASANTYSRLLKKYETYSKYNK